RAGTVVAFAIHDTGIGIAAEKLKVIFEPFQQAEMGTSRKYGGTGLGLSISREIARLLGGEIRVQSTPYEGTTFTLYVPQVYLPPAQRRPPAAGAAPGDGRPRPAEAAPRGAEAGSAAAPLEVGGDREALQPGDRVILIVEQDPKFAGILLDMAHEKGFKGL